MPVLPLATPFAEWTHGLYCDDFAESQGKDLETRVALGGFLPGCGVGTALRREAVEELAAAGDGEVFSPDALTEDYDLGFRMHRMGFRQRMIPLRWKDGAPVATREYFPRAAAAAVRQRTRWVTGNALQAWEMHGWGAGKDGRWRQAWFLWRDRKGLWGNAMSVVCNGLFLWGLAGWMAGRMAGAESALGHALRQNETLRLLIVVNLGLLAERIGIRAAVSGRIYGWRFALGAPLRMLWGNWINARATVRAMRVWVAAKFLDRPLLWLKTDHAYPVVEEEATQVSSRACAAAAGAGLSGARVFDPHEAPEWVGKTAPRLQAGRPSPAAAMESPFAGEEAPAAFRRWGEGRSRLAERRQQRSGPAVA